MDKETKKQIEHLREKKLSDQQIASRLLQDGLVTTVKGSIEAVKRWWEEEMGQAETDYHARINEAAIHIEELTLQLIRGEHNTYNHRDVEAKAGWRSDT